MSRLYEQLCLNTDFRAFIKDLLMQMGFDNNQFDILFEPVLNSDMFASIEPDDTNPNFNIFVRNLLKVKMGLTDENIKTVYDQVVQEIIYSLKKARDPTVTKPDSLTFRAYDFLVKMLPKEKINVLYNQKLNDTVMKEFAKCFITKGADPDYNYEVYELAGDVCVNSSVVMYLHKILQAAQDVQLRHNPNFLPDPRMKDYFHKLKSKYISNAHYKNMAVSLGFDAFIRFNPQIEKLTSTDSKIIASSFEGFFGCFESVIQKYQKKYPQMFKYSHTYVSYFISKIMHLMYIDYKPYSLYDSVTLLKESCDNTRPPNKAGYLYEPNINIHTNQMALFMVEYKTDGKDARPIRKLIRECGEIPDTTQVGKTQMAEIGLRYLVTRPDLFPTEFIKFAPRPDELGISELCM